jgi:transposase-like protein
MARHRKLHEADVKARVALEVVKQRQTAVQIARHFGVHPTIVNRAIGWVHRVQIARHFGVHPTR